MNIFEDKEDFFWVGLDVSNKNRDIKDSCSILVLELAGWLFIPLAETVSTGQKTGM